ncbi:MAG: hypothetical protein I3J02_09525 [Prevotella sp.]|nr:hypothetical protein [Prevotella sp.]
MKIKTFKTVASMAVGVLLSVGAASCSPEPAVNEKENKLHEDPVRAVFTLQEGTLQGEGKFDKQPREADFKSSGAAAQVIEWETTQADGWHVTSANDRFKVKNTQDNPNVVYSLKMEYYNAKGEMMNHQFFDLGQDKIHQHFFSMYKEVEFGGTKGSVRVSNKADLPYDYRYADELNGNYIGESNPMGFQGFIRFVKSGTKFTLSVDLLHAAESKFDDDGKASPFYLPAKVLLSTGLWDINVKLPVEIDGEPATEPSAMLLAADQVEIAGYEGHLHGLYSFHQNPSAKENNYMGKNYRLVYHMKNGQWVADEANAKMVSLIGSKSGGGVTAFSIRYFDKAGNDITGKLVEGGEDNHFQHFFIAKDIKPAYGGVKESTDENGPEFLSYLYCDTSPWDKTHKFDNATFTGEKNPIGVKGYFTFPHSHKTFNLEVCLMRAKESKMVGGKASPFYAPTEKQLKEEAWMPTITIPMNIYMDAMELELDADLLVDDISSLSTDEKTYSESDRKALHSFMEAFGVKSFETALAEFYWNLNGERKEDSTGFWF